MERAISSTGIVRIETNGNAKPAARSLLELYKVGVLE
jgi:hypothetical protein